MINSIKNKYYTYNPNEFMPIWYMGELNNRREFLQVQNQKAFTLLFLGFYILYRNVY